jgi:hypothetical protein
MTNPQLESLAHKGRSLSELTKFIDIREQTSSSYGVLLGAGASVTSGIRSGRELIDSWRRDQYLKLSQSDPKSYDAKEAVEWLSKNHLSWYDPKKEYSSLFQRTFDLPRQRRVFVEQEVANAFPSLGYAYLVRELLQYCVHDEF